MTFSMRRVSAIFRKEVQDFKTNSQVLLMAFLPIILSFCLADLERKGNVRHYYYNGLPICRRLCSIYGNCRRKRKHTLRVLMLSPASSVEVLLGKVY